MGYILFGIVTLAFLSALMAARNFSHKEARRKCIKDWEAIERASLHSCPAGDRSALSKFRELYASAKSLSMDALKDFGINNFGVMAYVAYEAFKKSFRDNAALEQEAEAFYREFVSYNEEGSPPIPYELRLIDKQVMRVCK